MASSKRWLLAARPQGSIKESDFKSDTASLDELSSEEVLVHNAYLSLDPAMRGWMSPVRSYIPPVEIGAVMRGGTVGTVVKSRNADYPVGTRVGGMLGWQEYALSQERHDAV